MRNPESTSKQYSHPKILSRYNSLYVIGKEIGRDKSVLDIGCAAGDLAIHLNSYDSRVWGVDGNAEALEEAKKHCEETKKIDLNSLPDHKIFEKKFDVVVFADVLEHLLEPEHVLEYFKSYLAPNSLIVVSLPNIALWRPRLNLLLGRFNYTNYGVMDRTHLHLYTFKTARKLIESAGFKIKKIQGAANIFGPVVKVMPFLRNLLSPHIIITARLD